MILTVFDLETTGLDKSKDSIIQFAGLKIDTNTYKIIEEFSQLIRPCGDYFISLGAQLKHGITKEMLADKPTMVEVGPQIVKFFEGVENILTYNGCSFDIPFLKYELNRFGYDIDFSSKNCYDSFLEEKRRNGNTLEATYQRYKGKSMEEAGLKAHDALSDVKATFSVFVAQQKNKKYEPEKLYGEDGFITDMMFCGKLCPCFAVGKYKGFSVEYIAQEDKNYIRWCVSDKASFFNSTKEFIKQYL